MHIQTIGYPAFIDYPARTDGAWHWTIDFAGSSESGYRQLRVTAATTAGTIDSDNLCFFGSWGQQLVHEYIGPDQTKNITLIAPIAEGFSASVKVCHTGSDPGEGNFTFVFEIETAPGSGVFEPVSLDNSTYVITKAGADFIEVGGIDPPDPVCFWQDLVGAVAQVCD